MQLSTKVLTHSTRQQRTLQRAGNTAYELRYFCKNEVEKGTKPAYIAKRLGKDNAWVTKHLAIIDMPGAWCSRMKKGYRQCGRDLRFNNKL